MSKAWLYRNSLLRLAPFPNNSPDTVTGLHCLNSMTNDFALTRVTLFVHTLIYWNIKDVFDTFCQKTYPVKNCQFIIFLVHNELRNKMTVQSGSAYMPQLVLALAIAALPILASLIARFMGPAWGPSGADRAQVGPMLAPWTLLSGFIRRLLSLTYWQKEPVYIYIYMCVCVCVCASMGLNRLCATNHTSHSILNNYNRECDCICQTVSY